MSNNKGEAEIIRVLLLDYHTLMRQGLRMLLESHPDIRVVAESGSAKEGLALATSLCADIILLDLNLDGELNTDIIAELIRDCSYSQIILVTGINDASIHHLAVHMGVMGVVNKSQPGDVLVKAIRKVHEGEVWLDRTMMAEVLTRFTRNQDLEDPEERKIASLSDRERQVIGLIGRGLKNKEIADQLFLSEVTIRHHLTSVYSKLEVSDRLELLIYAYQHNLAELPK
jgi:two-component system nitrate/nitrite response regulator NarL